VAILQPEAQAGLAEGRGDGAIPPLVRQGAADVGKAGELGRRAGKRAKELETGLALVDLERNEKLLNVTLRAQVGRRGKGGAIGRRDVRAPHGDFVRSQPAQRVGRTHTLIVASGMAQEKIANVRSAPGLPSGYTPAR